MNKKLFPLIMIVILAALGSIFFVWKEKQATPALPPVFNPVNAKEYKNDSYGIAFAYPHDYFLDEYDMSDGSAGSPQVAHRARHSVVLSEDTETNRAIREGRMMETEGTPSITIDIHQNNLDKQTVEDWVTGSAYSNFKLGDGTYESVTVAGVPAVHYFWDGLYPGESLVFAHQDNIIMLSGTYLEPTDRIRGDFGAVVQSFRLLY